MSDVPTTCSEWVVAASAEVELGGHEQYAPQIMEAILECEPVRTADGRATATPRPANVVRHVRDKLTQSGLLTVVMWSLLRVVVWQMVLWWLRRRSAPNGPSASA